MGINIHSGRHRVKENSRANYADVVEIDHEAQVMVIGDVARYFDRIRKNVNKAFMRQILRQALEGYCSRKREKERGDRHQSKDSIEEETEPQADDLQTDDGAKMVEKDADSFDEDGEEAPAQPEAEEEERQRPAMASRRRTESAVGIKPGMNRADLRSLKSLRGGDDEEDDDTRSLRSMAMAGRASRVSLRR